ncbi:MAG: hypothetical protein KY438_04830, partial [Actinobacteria bacterium]|nr:hypothetical protein [Actinomycetota bacterium]
SAMRTWAALADDALDTGEAAEASSSLFLSSSLEGRWHLDGGLDALSGEILHTALALASVALALAAWRTTAFWPVARAASRPIAPAGRVS